VGTLNPENRGSEIKSREGHKRRKKHKLSCILRRGRVYSNQYHTDVGIQSNHRDEMKRLVVFRILALGVSLFTAASPTGLTQAVMELEHLRSNPDSASGMLRLVR